MHKTRTMDEVMLDEHMVALMANRYMLAVPVRDYCDQLADMGIMLVQMADTTSNPEYFEELLDDWRKHYDALPDVERVYTRSRIVRWSSEVEALFLINGHR